MDMVFNKSVCLALIRALPDLASGVRVCSALNKQGCLGAGLACDKLGFPCRTNLCFGLGGHGHARPSVASALFARTNLCSVLWGQHLAFLCQTHVYPCLWRYRYSLLGFAYAPSCLWRVGLSIKRVACSCVGFANLGSCFRRDGFTLLAFAHPFSFLWGVRSPQESFLPFGRCTHFGSGFLCKYPSNRPATPSALQVVGHRVGAVNTGLLFIKSSCLCVVGGYDAAIKRLASMLPYGSLDVNTAPHISLLPLGKRGLADVVFFANAVRDLINNIFHRSFIALIGLINSKKGGQYV